MESLAQGHSTRSWQNSYPGVKPSSMEGAPMPEAHAGGSHQGGLIHNEALREGSKNEEPTHFLKWPFLGDMEQLGLTSGTDTTLGVGKQRANGSQMRGAHQKLGNRSTYPIFCRRGN